MRNKLKWRSMNHCINGDGGKSEMSDTDLRIAELERQLDAKDAWIEELETSNPAWELLISTQNEVVKWKREVIKWQDTDTMNQEKIEAKDAEIADLEKGFIDVDAVLKRDVELARLCEENERLKKGLET